MTKYVQISPFYNGAGWYDKVSGIFFNPEVKEYKIPEGTNCSKINTYIIKNLLIDTTHLHNKDVAEKKHSEEVLEKSKSDFYSANMLLKEEKYHEGINIEKKMEESNHGMQDKRFNEKEKEEGLKEEVISSEEVVQSEVEKKEKTSEVEEKKVQFQTKKASTKKKKN